MSFFRRRARLLFPSISLKDRSFPHIFFSIFNFLHLQGILLVVVMRPTLRFDVMENQSKVKKRK